jgi:hypothetical protein
MIVIELMQVLFGMAAFFTCTIACLSLLRGQGPSGIHVATAGGFALIFFLSVAQVRYELVGIAVLTILAGLLLQRAPERTSDEFEGDDTAVRRRYSR